VLLTIFKDTATAVLFQNGKDVEARFDRPAQNGRRRPLGH
jgi:hypothetical protein